MTYPSDVSIGPNIGRCVGFTSNCDHCSFVQGQAQHRFQHRHVDMLAFLIDRALVQRRRDRAERIDAGEDVGVIDAAIVRPASSGLICKVRHLIARGGVDHRRIGRQFRRRPGLAVSGDRAIDQLRIELAQRSIVELQSPHHARAEILDQHVGACDQTANRFHSLGRFQIEHQTFLADVELAEGGAAIIAHRRAGSHRLAFGGFDLDDLGAHIGEHPRAMRSGDRGRKIEHAQAARLPVKLPAPLPVSSFCKAPFAPPAFISGAGRDPKLRRHRRKAFPARSRSLRPLRISRQRRLDPILA